MPRVTIIETGLVPPQQREKHGSLPQMFERMIGAADDVVARAKASLELPLENARLGEATTRFLSKSSRSRPEL